MVTSCAVARANSPKDDCPRGRVVGPIGGELVARGSLNERLMKAAKFGRIAAQSIKAQARRANTQRRHAAAKRTWNKSEQPTWLTEKEYLEQIQPRLAGITLSVLSSTLGVSEPYAVDIRAGRRVPHPRHWQTLAEIVRKLG